MKLASVRLFDEYVLKIRHVGTKKEIKNWSIYLSGNHKVLVNFLRPDVVLFYEVLHPFLYLKS